MNEQERQEYIKTTNELNKIFDNVNSNIKEIKESLELLKSKELVDFIKNIMIEKQDEHLKWREENAK